MQTKPTFFIADSQFNSSDADMPPMDWILESLSDVLEKLSTEETWTHKGNYRFSFWIDPENPNTTFCNAFVLSNPDDITDYNTKSYCYYFEIERV